MLYTCNVQLINEPLFYYYFFYYFYDSLVGMNWHESYFATLYQGDNANQSYQHTSEKRMSMNQHETYIKPIFYHYISILRGSSHSHEGGSESLTPNLEVTTLVPNKRSP